MAKVPAPKVPAPKIAALKKWQLSLRLVDLPEAELLRRDLDRELFTTQSTTTSSRASKIPFVKVSKAEVLKKPAILPHKRPDDFVKKLTGKKIVKVQRKGRYLFFLLEEKNAPDEILVVNFDSGGMLRKTTAREAMDPATAVVIGLGGWGQLRFLETKQDAHMYMVPRAQLNTASPLLARMGVDAISQPVSWQQFHQRCQATSRKSLKSLLCDENFVVGVGDVYSDEVLFHAELNYSRFADTLTPTEVRRLCRALAGTLHEAVKQRGTTLQSRPFLDLFGDEGSYGDYLEVFQRDGELSSRGGNVIKSRFSSRWTYYCDKTQMLEVAPIS